MIYINSTHRFPFSWRRLRRSVAGGRQCKGCDEDESLILFQSDDSQKPAHEQGGPHESNRQNNYVEAAEGRVLLREVLKQLITSVAFLNERGIVHVSLWSEITLYLP